MASISEATGPGRERRRGAGAWLVALLCLGGADCSQAIGPTPVDDALLVARVRSALVNDDGLGLRPIEVTVVVGRVRLAGQVASVEEERRAVALAQGVPGVGAVDSVLDVVAPEELRTAPSTRQELAFRREAEDLIREEGPDWAERRLLAVGVSVTQRAPVDAGLEPSFGVGPIARLGSREGLGVSVGFGWFEAATASSAPGQKTDGIRVRPVLAGVGYTVPVGRASLTWSALGGPAFNSVRRRGQASGPRWMLDVENSLAWRGGMSVWVDLSDRTAVHASASYVVTRPTVSYLEDGVFAKETLKADTALVSGGVAFKVF